MRELIGNPAFAKNVQLVLIVAYALLAVLFGLQKKSGRYRSIMLGASLKTRVSSRWLF
jgi:hypothetical protein